MADIKARDIKLVEIEKLVPNPKNNNRHPVEQLERLAKIIEFQGFRDPIIVSNRSGFIVCGHARLDVAKKIGMEKVPVVYQDFDSEAQEYAHLTADNEIARWAELDYQELYENLKEIELDDVDMLGIEDFKMPEVEELNPQADEDDVPEAPPEPVTKRGDIWLLGNHRLMCGDSTLIDDVEKLMNGEKADMVFTDPPYNIASDSKNFAAGTSRSMNDLKNSEWDKGFKIEDFLPLAIEQTKDSATYYVWSSHFLISKIWDILKEYCDFHSYLIWDKPNPMPSLSKRHPTWNTEICGYGTRGSKRIVNFPKDGHFLSCREVIKKSDGSHQHKSR